MISNINYVKCYCIGSFGALKLELNVEQYEYTTSITSAGFQVQIIFFKIVISYLIWQQIIFIRNYHPFQWMCEFNVIYFTKPLPFLFRSLFMISQLNLEILTDFWSHPEWGHLWRSAKPMSVTLICDTIILYFY